MYRPLYDKLSSDPTVIDFNNYFNFDSFIYDGVFYYDFDDWKAVSGFDTRSIISDPNFSDKNNISGDDGILWTGDDGLIPISASLVCGAGIGESDIGAYDCQDPGFCHPADDGPPDEERCDGIISTTELMNYIAVWIGTPGTSIMDLMEVISLWRS